MTQKSLTSYLHICLLMLTQHSLAQVPRPSSLFSLPPELRDMIYTFTYGDLQAITYAHNCDQRPEIWGEIDHPASDDGELSRILSSYYITGLHHVCRELRRETMDYNPLHKIIEGDSKSLVRLFSQFLNPLKNLRGITIYLRPGDTNFISGKVTLSDDLYRLIRSFSGMKELATLNIQGCTSFFDAEEKAAFVAIWEALRTRIVVRKNLSVSFNCSRPCEMCSCCMSTCCECLSITSWAKCMKMITTDI